jgi:hypothetical protein
LSALQLLYYHLESLLLKILEENPVKQGQVKLNRANRAHARDVVRDAVAARRPAAIQPHTEVPLRSSVRAWCLGHCGKVRLTRSRALGRCHAFRPHALVGAAASRHWLDGHRTSPPTPRHTRAIPPPYHDYSPWCARNPHHRLAFDYKRSTPSFLARAP